MKYLSLIAMTSVIAGCSSFQNFSDTTNLIDYSNNKSVKLLEVPAGLDKPVFDKTYVASESDTLLANKSGVVDTSVPLVDSSMATLSASSLVVAKEGSQVGLKINDGGKDLWARSLAAITSMGMTVSKSDEATGIVNARDRSLVSSAESPIGAFLNRTIGRVNKGVEYQVLVKDNSIVFKNKDGSVLKENESKVLLGRLKKELTRTK